MNAESVDADLPGRHGKAQTLEASISRLVRHWLANRASSRSEIAIYQSSPLFAGHYLIEMD